jgi:hypothetical protein
VFSGAGLGGFSSVKGSFRSAWGVSMSMACRRYCCLRQAMRGVEGSGEASSQRVANVATRLASLEQENGVDSERRLGRIVVFVERDIRGV